MDAIEARPSEPRLRCVLLVEDEWQVARELARAFEKQGTKVVGPVPDVRGALRLIAGSETLDGAVVDINLQGEMAFPVVDALEQRGIPFVFATGYDRASIPLKYRAVPTCHKPFEPADVALLWNRCVEKQVAGEAAALTGNLLLAALTSEDKELVWPLLEPTELPVRTRLERPKRVIEHCYFLRDGLASIVAATNGGDCIEVGMIGREGVTGLAVLMGSDRSIHETIMQISGSGMRIESEALRALADRHPSLRRTLLRFGHALHQQMAHTTLAAGRYSIEQRLARWLLMMSDRVGGDSLTVTHESIALMLGVRRAGVTHAIHTLVDHGLIGTSRRMISIIDRAELTKTAGGCYGAPETELERVLGIQLRG